MSNSIFGTIYDNNGSPTPGVLVNYKGPSSGGVVTDGSGDFLISGLSNGSYVVTPDGNYVPVSPTFVLTWSPVFNANFFLSVAILGTIATMTNVSPPDPQTGATKILPYWYGLITLTDGQTQIFWNSLNLANGTTVQVGTLVSFSLRGISSTKGGTGVGSGSGEGGTVGNALNIDPVIL